MNKKLGLKILSKVMEWDDEQAIQEFRWLTFMAAYKYDSYRDYLAGARFIESLITWLQQFSEGERSIAYAFVKENLIYFSVPEMNRLVEKFFPEFVQKVLVQMVSDSLNIQPYKIWATKENIASYKRERRKTLFMGLSDGARIDTLRRMNTGVLSNDQIVGMVQIDQNKWGELLKDLNEDLKSNGDKIFQDEKFTRLYLIDDFTGSGTTFLRKVNGKLKGKLLKLAKSLQTVNEDDKFPFVKNYEIIVHHYVGTEQAKINIENNYKQYMEEIHLLGLKCRNIKFTFGMILPSGIKILKSSQHPFVKLCVEYYNPALEGSTGEHALQSGVKSIMFGYGNCGLPVVFEHNTPNNSLPLLWADTPDEQEKHNMRPLFRRRQRHSDMEQDFNKSDEDTNA